MTCFLLIDGDGGRLLIDGDGGRFLIDGCDIRLPFYGGGPNRYDYILVARQKRLIAKKRAQVEILMRSIAFHKKQLDTRENRYKIVQLQSRVDTLNREIEKLTRESI